MTRIVSVLLFTLTVLQAAAQEDGRPLRKFVVADAETRVPVRDVIVFTRDGYSDTTNYRGICYIPVSFDTLTVYKANYLTERLVPREVKDSTFLLPNHRRIGEVTVWGKDGSKSLEDDIRRRSAEEAQQALPDPSAAATVNFDFGRLLDRRYRKDMKHLKKTRKIFKKMDTYDEDPIVNGYYQRQEEKRLAEERRKRQKELAARKRQEEQKQLEEKVRATEAMEQKDNTKTPTP